MNIMVRGINNLKNREELQNMQDLRAFSYEEMQKLILSLGEKSYRAKQIYTWVSKGASKIDEITNLSKHLREKLNNIVFLDNVKIIERLESNDQTIKFLNKLNGQNIVESVFMSYKHGNSICISTQAGCKMKCSFCASAINGFDRNLTSGEMMGQIYEAQNITGKRINNVVLMGSGEPLDNFEETLKFIRLVNEKGGLNISQRNITLSTCGIIPKIYKLADEYLKITLAISLHNPFEGERERIMPITRKYPLDELFKAVDYYIEKTRRRVTFEYALIKETNDSTAHAEKLGEKLKGKLVHVNLIPMNEVIENNYCPSDSKRINDFKRLLIYKYKINTTIRKELGSDINAACGQLRNKHIKTAHT